jgi:hypothetical protein
MFGSDLCGFLGWWQVSYLAGVFCRLKLEGGEGFEGVGICVVCTVMGVW